MGNLVPYLTWISPGSCPAPSFALPRKAACRNQFRAGGTGVSPVVAFPDRRDAGPTEVIPARPVSTGEGAVPQQRADLPVCEPAHRRAQRAHRKPFRVGG